MENQARYPKVARIILISALTLLATYAQAAPPSYAVQVLADGPVGYWRLGEAPGASTAADSSGNANNGNYTGGITLGQLLVPGDTAALFDGATGRIVVQNSATNNPARITMEAKVRWDGSTGLQQRILEKESFGGTTQYGLSVTPSGNVHVELRMRGDPPTDIKSADSTRLVTVGQETHIAATFDGLKICIYLNGIPDSPTCTTINSTPRDIDTKWPHTPPDDPEVALAIGDRIGFNLPGHRTFKGLIDEVALFDKALSADRILAHFQSQTQGGFQYAAKFVCLTNIRGTSAATTTVLPGAYATVVNIHNPNSEAVGLRKKIAVPGKVSKFFEDKYKLGPDQMTQVDCTQILKDFGIRFIHGAEGFLVIESPLSLDVIAVYTAGKRAPDDAVQSIEVERVEERRLPVK